MLLDIFESWVEIFAEYGLLGLFIVAFAESSFSPIPPDILIITFTLVDPNNWILYSLVSSLGSVLGAGLGYLIGYKIGEPILHKFAKKETIKKAHDFFEKYGTLAVLLSAFTPIPFKIFTILSGVLSLDLKKFFIAAIIGRTARFLIVGYITFAHGRTILEVLDQFMLIIAIIILVIGAAFTYKKWKKVN